MKNYRSKIIIAVLLIVFMIILRYSGIKEYISLDFVKQNSAYLLDVIGRHYFVSASIFCMILIGVVALAIPISIILTIASGFFFGIIPGTVFSILSATAGASISFFIFRYLLSESVRQKYGKALDAFKQQFKRHGVSYLLFMQLLPITPFGVINILSGISGIAWWKFALATAVGILPGTIIYTYAGQQLHRIENVKDILTPDIMIALSLMALLALLPIVLRYFKIIK